MKNGVVLEPAKAAREWWQPLAMLLASVVIALVGAWAAWAGDKVSEPRVREIVERESPYAQDRGVIRLQLKQQTAAIDRLTARVDELVLAQERLSAELASNR